MANTARQFVREELARGDESLLTDDIRVVEQSEGVDRIHIHGTWLPVLWKVAKLARRKGAELIVRPCGNYDPIRIRRGPVKRIKKWLAGPFEHAMLSRADFVQATCEDEAEWIRAYHPKARIALTDLKRFFDISVKSVRPRENRCGEKLHVLYLGRNDPLKGIQYLKMAVSDVNRQAMVSLPGCPEAGVIELHIVSNKFGEELEKEWEWSDVLCLPTLSENFGRVVAEALERGKFVVTTDGAPAWADLPPEKGVFVKGFRDAGDGARVRLLADVLRKLSGRPAIRAYAAGGAI